MRGRTRVIGAAGGAFGLSGFAAAVGLCCTVPWAVTLLGVTGAVAFARLAFLLPFALVGAIGSLAAAFWWAYREPVSCDTGTCAPKGRRALKVVVWAAAAVVIVFSVVALTAQVTLY
jgi:hypothetical protein